MNKRVLTYVGAGLLAVLGAGLLAVSMTRAGDSGDPVLDDSTSLAVDVAPLLPVPDEQTGNPDNAVPDGQPRNSDDADGGSDPDGDVVDGSDAALAAVAAPVVIDVPDRLMQISFALDTERTFAGQLRPGDLVGVFASYEEAQVSDLILQKVLVVSIREEAPLPIDEGDVDRLPAAPAGRFFVTLALDAADAQTLTHALEFGRVWLSFQPGLADENAPGVASLETVLTDSFDDANAEAEVPVESELAAADGV
jgi:pilus assembly protein CpaB